MEGILWHPLGIHAGCNGGKQKQTVGKKYMSLATQDVVVKSKETRKAEHELGGNRWAVSTWIGLRLGSELSS